jgi:phage tail sheath protein FI
MTMGFQLSPGVQTKEIDLSTSIPAVATSLGATVGRFTWGPVDEPYLCTSENDLVSVFGKPTNDTFPAFLSSAAFLNYANSLQVVRVVDSTATNASANGGVEQIKNTEDFETQKGSGTLTEAFYARYPGTYGNGISVHTQNGVDGWDTWQYKDSFDVQPDSTNSEVAVAVVVDTEVVESYLVSNVEGNKDTMGGNIFMEEKINAMSKLIWTVAANVNVTTVAAFCSDVAHTTEAACTGASETWTAADPSAEDISFSGGNATRDFCSDVAYTTEATCVANTETWTVSAVGSGEYQFGWDQFANADEIDVNLLIAGGVTNETTTTVTDVSKYMVETIAEVRKDCMAILSPPKEKVCYTGSSTNAVNNVVAWRKTDLNLNSSYATLDANYKYTYDKYSDTYRWIGFSGDVAGLMANTDSVRDAWWSPAGLNRGQIKSVVKVAYNPTQAHRDQLYMLPNGINPIVSFPGQGTVLWGDRTMLTKPSAFDRINVRRLFIIIEKSIAISAKYFLFEFNNAFTRTNFNNMANPYLAGLQARQAMQDFLVKCDESNNGPEVVDANQFVASIFIKPSKSINFITLNFVATKSGVAFSEVVGQV